jgi:hypothetical protein
MSGRRRWIIWALFPLGFCVAAAPTTTNPAQDEKPTTIAEAKAKQQAEALAEAAKLPIINAKSIADVLSISLRDNDLALATKLPATDDSVVRVPGVPGLSRMRVMGSQLDPTFIAGFEFSNMDFGPPDVVAVQTSIGVAAGNVTLFRAYQELEDETHTIQLIQHPDAADGEPRVMLYVQITGSSPVNLRRGAASVVELRRRYPADVAKYVDPIFRTLKQDGFLANIEPRLAWQVFAEAYQPPAQLQSQVQAAIAKLDANEFREREAASADLEKLGEPAALTIMHMDRSHFSDEQKSRLDAFLSRFKLISDAEVNRLRHESDFLLDCLNSDQPAIRQAALNMLRQVTGKPIAFDLDAAPESRLAAIDRLRAQVGTAPATQSTTTTATE